MLTVKDYDENKLSDFLKKGSYSEAAQYLSQFRLNDNDRQMQLNNHIEQLNQKANTLNYLYNNSPASVVQAIQFKEAWNNGTHFDELQNNPYASQFNQHYQTVMDALTKDKIIFDNKIHKNYFFGIDWLNSDDEYAESGWELFKHNLGLDKDESVASQQLKDLGIEYEYDSEGRALVSFKETDLNNHIRIAQALHNTDTNHSIYNGRDKLDDSVDGRHRWESSSKHSAIRTVNDIKRDPFVIFNEKDVEADDLTDPRAYAMSFADFLVGGSKKVVDTVGGPLEWAFENIIKPIGKHSLFGNPWTDGKTPDLDSSLSKLLSVYDEADKTYNKFMGYNDEEVTGTIQMFNGTPSVNHMELEKLRSIGAIKIEEYNKSKAHLDTSLKAALKGATTNYLDHDIYAVDLDEDGYTLKKVTKDKDRQSVIETIAGNADVLNVDEDVAFAMSAMGDGIMITIDPNKDSNSKSNALSPYFDTRRRQYFIQGFLESDLTDKYRQSDDYKSIMALNRSCMYGQPVDVSDTPGETKIIAPAITVDGNGNKVVDRNNLQLITTNKEGYYKSDPISREAAITEINKGLTINSAVNQAIMSLYGPDGNYRENPNLNKQLNNVVSAMMKEFYPNETQMIENGPKLGYDVSNERSFIQKVHDNILAEMMRRVKGFVDNDTKQ